MRGRVTYIVRSGLLAAGHGAAKYCQQIRYAASKRASIMIRFVPHFIIAFPMRTAACVRWMQVRTISRYTYKKLPFSSPLRASIKSAHTFFHILHILTSSLLRRSAFAFKRTVRRTCASPRPRQMRAAAASSTWRVCCARSARPQRLKDAPSLGLQCFVCVPRWRGAGWEYSRIREKGDIVTGRF